ncbi:transcription repressor NadR [Ferroacidibacillus organovorans]|uniref:Transcription repressor NadR n=1 Tax=Ferroacidibacillus organovorans TaxID=1765683 RepID=A0A168C4D7_9BACL|nr:transcription repressor NadR [Ferroacidibacillus organovorans]KYP81533.1 hypothetical protein AYJ22_07330 [Ferroacidibacillus organovorans]OAG94034.1 hypothetical protein AYW79_07320 [Ferroacidibacillus organovorans]OPG16888.1 transcription repressor NadR [Ferroacidibacillus organovorans]
MDGQERARRQEMLIDFLRQAEGPLSGTQLARRLGVTRQVVVHDIALMRAAGVTILSTPQGYIYQQRDSMRSQTVLGVNHTPEQTALELYTMVDFGLYVMDVQVEHPLYGMLSGALRLASRRDVELFLEQVQRLDAPLLSSITGGSHYHTIAYRETRHVEEAIAKLRAVGIHVDDA